MPFYEIFPNKKKNKTKTKNLKKDNKKPKIIIDTREKNSLVPSELSSLNIDYEFQHLEIADYIINNIAIERKTLSDLKSSIINKRIFTQVENLKKYPSYFVIIETNNEDIYSGIIHENALRGFFISQAIQKVPIIFSKNEKDTARYLSVLAKKKSSDISLRPSKSLLTKKQQVQFILEGFPHIGPKKAQRLIEQFESLKKIINASEEDLSKILGKSYNSFIELIE